jgi:hypothetical protein
MRIMIPIITIKEKLTGYSGASIIHRGEFNMPNRFEDIKKALVDDFGRFIDNEKAESITIKLKKKSDDTKGDKR